MRMFAPAISRSRLEQLLALHSEPRPTSSEADFKSEQSGMTVSAGEKTHEFKSFGSKPKL